MNISISLIFFLQEFLQQIREKQSEVTRLSEALGKLSDGKACLVMDEIRRLKRCWRDLSQRAEELEAQRGEDMQRSVEFQEAVVSVEELFHQVSREWDYLARYQSSSIFFKHCSFHLQISFPYNIYLLLFFHLYQFQDHRCRTMLGHMYTEEIVYSRACVCLGLIQKVQVSI